MIGVKDEWTSGKSWCEDETALSRINKGDWFQSERSFIRQKSNKTIEGCMGDKLVIGEVNERIELEVDVDGKLDES